MLLKFERWILNHIPQLRRVVLGALLAFVLFPIRLYDTGIGYDTYEYVAMANAFYHHGTPDIRPLDEPAHPRPPIGLYTSASTGDLFAWHFWLYSLCAAPFMALPSPWGGDALNAFATLNRSIFAVALWFALFCTNLPRPQRALWVTLSACSIVMLYVCWLGPELFCWALMMVSLGFLSARRYIGAASCATLAAMQNPPLLFISFCCAALSLNSRSRRVIGLSMLAALGSFLPSAFYFLHFGTPSLIALHHYADRSYISLERLWSLFFDLNLACSSMCLWSSFCG